MIVQIQSQTTAVLPVHLEAESSGRTINLEPGSVVVLDLESIDGETLERPSVAIVSAGPSVELYPMPQEWGPSLPLYTICFLLVWLSIKLW